MQLVLGDRAVGLGEQLLGLVEQRELLARGCPRTRRSRGVDLGLGRVEHVAGGLELRPERVVELLAGAAGELPLVEQAAVVGDRRRRPCGASASARSTSACLRVRASRCVGVELGEERLAVRLDRRARRAESLPELVALVLGQARAVLLVRLPAGEERVELRGDLLPLRLRRVLRGERLGLGDERLALGERGGDRLLRLGRTASR